jgi:hypothetical protein
MTDNVFDPAQHKVVAVNAEGQHIHVTLGELKADMAQLPAAPANVETVSVDRLAVAVAVASHAVMCGVQAGDFRWHGGAADFVWEGTRMDAPSLIEYAKAML